MKTLKRLWIVLFVFGLCVTGAQGREVQEKPTVMIMINEQIFVGTSVIYDYYGNLKDVFNIWTSASQADITFIGTFMENGFRVIGGGIPITTNSDVSRGDILKAMEGDDSASVNIGWDFDADVVIVGKAIARGVSGLEGSSQKSARANVNVRVIKVKTGEIIAVESDHATASAIDELSAGVEAIKMAARSISKSLVEKVSE